MISQSFNLVLLKSLAFQFAEYTVLIAAFFLFFVLMNKFMDKVTKMKKPNTEALSN